MHDTLVTEDTQEEGGHSDGRSHMMHTIEAEEAEEAQAQTETHPEGEAEGGVGEAEGGVGEGGVPVENMVEAEAEALDGPSAAELAAAAAAFVDDRNEAAEAEVIPQDDEYSGDSARSES
jgi:hypothetical protein